MYTQLLQIHLSLANLTTAIHFTLASHKQISTNFNAFKIHWHVSLQILQNITVSLFWSCPAAHHTNTQKTTLASYQTKNRLQNLSYHIQNTYKSTTYISLRPSINLHAPVTAFMFTCSGTDVLPQMDKGLGERYAEQPSNGTR